MSKTILILGGYGNTGRLIAQLLVEELQDIRIIIAGRNLGKAKDLAAKLNRRAAESVVSSRFIDIAQPNSLLNGITDVDLVVNAASTIQHTGQILRTLLQHPVDYLDTHLSSPEKLAILQRNHTAIKDAGLCYVTDGGFHPGIPAALIRYADMELDELTQANIYGALRIDWAAIEASRSTWVEFIREFRDYQMLTLRDGQWQKWSFWKSSSFDFGSPFGRLGCVPMVLEELKEASRQIPQLRESGFFISGFNPIMDNFLLPIIMVGASILPTKWYSPLIWLLQIGFRFNRPPFGVKLVADCQGAKMGKPANLQIAVAHEDGYWLTAVPVVATIMQLLYGTIREPGLHLQANLVEPQEFIDTLQKLDILVEKTTSYENYQPEPEEH